jgi:biopolymer transport protein ExbD
MDLNRLRALVAAPMASLFLILTLCAFLLQRPGAVGMHVPLPKVRTVPYDDCEGVDRWVVVLLHKDGSYWINETQVPADELRSKLGEIYENRKYKLIYMFSDPDVSYGEFANFYSIVESSTTELRIGLRTRQLEAQLQQCPLGSSCGLEWPDHMYIPCVERQIPLVPIPHHARH